VAYRADIEIAVRGASQITNLKTQVESLSAGVDKLNRTLSTGTVASVDNFTKLVSQSERVLRSAAQGTDVQRKAIDAYIRSVAAAEKAEKSLQTAIAGRRRELGIAAPTAAGGQARGGRLGGAISNAAIGAAFPLLFGQSGAAAAGGAIGGIAGSALGPTGGFAGSLVGTLIGEKLGQANQVKELAADIGFSAEQTKLLGVAFQQAGRDFDKFQASVSTIQGLSLSIEDQARAIQLASTLTENYGGKIDKVTNAFANALSTGKVTQGTLNQLTNQGIPIQEALANKYNISRTALLEYAKEGKISVQDLIDTLVEVGNKGTTAANAQRDAFADSFDQINTALSNFQTTATDAFKSTADALRIDLGDAIQAVTGYTVDFINGFSELTRIAGPALDGILSAYINIEKAIFNAVGAVPALRDAIISFALAALGPLQGVARLIDSIRSVGAATKGPEKQGPYVPERLKRKPLESFFAPSQAAPSGGSSAADKAARDAKRLAEQTEKQLQASIKLLAISRAELVIAQTTDPLKKAEAQYALDRLRITQNYADKLKEAKSAQETSNLKAAQNAEFEKLRLDYLEKQTTELLKQAGITTPGFGLKSTGIDFNQAFQFQGTLSNGLTDQIGTVTEDLTKLLDPIEQVKTAAESIGSAFSTSFKGLIDGSQSAQEALAGFFKSVASSFLDAAAQIIAKWIELTILNSIVQLFPGGGGIGIGNTFSNFTSSGGAIPSLADSLKFVPGRAVGGPVTPGSPYIVGEKGPELFVPGRSGTIVPNNAMMGGSTSVVVNVDASGNSNVQGDQAQGKQLGLAVSAAVQAELVKQKRPGGLLYSR